MIDESSLQRLQAIGLTPPLLGRALALAADHPDAQLLRVTEVQREGLRLHDGERESGARLLPALRQRLADAADAVAVGDWVLADFDAHGQRWVAERLPPLCQIARRLHDGRDKLTRTVIVSNVDTALLVMGLDQDYNLRRLERYLALARFAGVAVVVVLTKADLCSPDRIDGRLRELGSLLPAGASAVALDARAGAAREVLAPWLGAGQTLVLLGSSGVGKSTLSNALTGAALQATGASRAGDGRGRHTTTTRTLHGTPEGACLIDTPGLRALRLDGDAGALDAVFGDVASLAPACRFRDCRHADEPGCAVRDGVAPERLRSYHKLQREAERDTLTVLQRREQVAAWKARSRAARERLRAKQG
jgi:ribosome biogenesis GTPase / thiamine phosphate phosphatase